MKKIKKIRILAKTNSNMLKILTETKRMSPVVRKTLIDNLLKINEEIEKIAKK